ncbi:MAG: hypothetical protein E4H11_01020, partial [Myxococcales bacterium]
MTPFSGSKRGPAAAAACALLLACAGCGASGEPNGGASGQNPEAALETRLRVRTETVQRGKLEAAGSVTGTIRAFHRTTLTAETQGRVVARRVPPGAQVA